ncbi:hypothetical protein DI487_05805 [Flavobacterium sediminis]|uniref:Uncharacterized protein n=1 Tax=Flavobacterium sediminis TaxID=2201181 RepID=A0A2U8QTC9_9FLAO|nr:hypothetical protein [Flavobacterium sediminis]AWM13422.1 hypothetical protein DI487_05805 [Flavobacterium sediminis]
MKKKLEGELISIAHRVLKLKNRSETKQLQEEAKKLYEQLTILRFYEENFEIVKEEIAPEVLEEKLETISQQTVVAEQSDVVAQEEQVEEPIVEEEPAFEPEVAAELAEEEPTQQEEIEAVEVVEEETVSEIASEPQVALFDDVFAADFKELDFVKVEDVPQEVEQVADLTFEAAPETDESQEQLTTEDKQEEPVAVIEETEIESQPEPVAELRVDKTNVQEIVIEEVPEVVFEEPKAMSLNDRLNKGGINIGLNDRIAFEKKLFDGSTDDFNRVLSQLNTFDSFDEARGFIDSFVKPDYNNWEGKEEYEVRFLEFVEKKYL